MADPLLLYDTKDDRTEMGRLLSALAPADRVRFLSWAIAQLPKGKLPPPVPYGYRELVEQAYRCDRADARLTRTVFCDILSLCAAFQLDPTAMVRELERRGRRGR